jgi:DNA (cytosine-5)-methyltransferase 1
MNELHLFAGAGGGILGGILLGHQPCCAVELDEHARKILIERQRDGCLPWFPVWDNVTTFDGTPWKGIAEIVCGGFPCQDISSAGSGKGLEGERSGLWAEMRRIIREVEPEYVFVENSPMLTVRGLGVVLGDLATMGYDAAWGVMGASDVGLWHYRKRIWILAHHHAQRGRSLHRRAAEKQGNMGINFKAESPIDRYMDEMERQGIQCTAHGEQGSMPPYLCRVDDELANPVDRLARIGNGQVPLVAATAWRTLSAKLNSANTPAQPPQVG